MKRSNCLAVFCFLTIFVFVGGAWAGINDGLILNWSFKDCSTKDFSPSGYDPYITGSPTCVDGINGKAYHFTGVDHGNRDFLAYSDTELLGGLAQFTISTWFNTENIPQESCLASMGGDMFKQFFLGPNSAHGGKIYFGVNIGGGNNINVDVISNIAVQTGQWHHLAVVYDGSFVKMYVDGVLQNDVASASGAVTIDTQYNFRGIFLGQEGTNPSYRAYNGDVDEFRVYNRPLPADEINQLIHHDNGPSHSMLWEQVNEDGFLEAGNVGVYAMTTRDVHLYVGVLNSGGSKIYRTNDGYNWTQVMNNGFGNINNEHINCMGVFGPYIYAGTENGTDGMQVFRSSDGINWNQVGDDGLGDTSNTGAESMTVFNSHLYLGTSNLSGGLQIWRTSDGTDWTRVEPGGFGDSQNQRNFTLQQFGSYLYAGVGMDSANGSEVHRTSDGTSWNAVDSGGFGDSNNQDIYAMEVFGSHLYAGTRNEDSGGTELWRTRNGTDWEKANIDGFGDNTNDEIASLGKIDGSLFAGTINENTGTEIWRSNDGTIWEQVNIDGFGDAAAFGPYAMADYDGKLYIAAKNSSSGCEVWSTPFTWNTFLGSSGEDAVRRVVLNADGGMYVTGYSTAAWGSPVNEYHGASDGFAARLDSTGAVVWNTFLGSAGEDWLGLAFAADSNGNMYVTGQSAENWGNPLNPYTGGEDIFVAKLDKDGNLKWHTFLGSAGGDDRGVSLALDDNGNIYVVGYCSAAWGDDPVDAYTSGWNPFAAKLNNAGELQWNTFMGGTYGYGIDVDDNDFVYVTGQSSTSWGSSPVNGHSGSRDVFVTKLNDSGDRQWHTFLGQGGLDEANTVRVDTNDGVYVGGYSDGSWGIPEDGHSGGYDGLLMKLNGDNGDLIWHTFMGAAGNDEINEIAFDTVEDVYVNGNSSGSWGSPIYDHSGGVDAFGAKFDGNGVRLWNFFSGSATDDYGRGIAVSDTGDVFTVGESDDVWSAPLRVHQGDWDGFVSKFSYIHTLAVKKDGTGSGTVSSNTNDIDCGGTCSHTYNHGARITLTATPDFGFVFNGWDGGGCSGTGTCEVTMDQALAITATFDLEGSTSGLAAYYPFDGNAQDASGNNHHGTVQGATLTTDRFSDADSAYQFNGIDDIIDLGITQFSNEGSFSFWIKSTQTSAASFGEYSSDASAIAINLFAYGNSIGLYSRVNNGPILQYDIVDDKVNDGSWHHFVITWDTVNQGVNIFLDGEEATTVFNDQKASPNIAAKTFNDWYVGAQRHNWSNSTWKYYQGSVDEFRVYDRILSEQEIQDLFIAGGLPERTLTVNKAGTGSGTVSGNDNNIDCGNICTHTYDHGDIVILTATPADDSTFAGWTGGGCSGKSTCQVTMDQAKTVTATFTKKSYVLSVQKTGTGSGTVSSADNQISCGTTCTHNYYQGDIVTLMANAEPDSVFSGWSGGGCSGAGTCQVTMDEAKTVTATFTKNTCPLTIEKNGNGSGIVKSNDGNIDCGNKCYHDYICGEIVILTAIPDEDSTFDGWSGGGCSGAGTCQVTLDEAKDVKATFTIKQHTLNILKDGTGTGTVKSDDGHIDCGNICAHDYDHGEPVILTAIPDEDSTFDGWSGGGCSGAGTCQVTMDEAKDVTAIFTKKTYTLTVQKDGTGKGTVTSKDGHIDCGNICVHDYDHGEPAELTAIPDEDSTFNGWSGGITSSDNPLSIGSITSDLSIIAKFEKKTCDVTILNEGDGTGTVNGVPCAESCVISAECGSPLSLTAIPDECSDFDGWRGGGCSGTGTCEINVDGPMTITLSFSQTCAMYKLSVTTEGGGTGSAISAPPGINCGTSGTDCEHSFQEGKSIQLLPNPDNGCTFAGWVGDACSGTGPCIILMERDTAVTALFEKCSLSVFTKGTGEGKVTSQPSGIDCGEVCESAFPLDTVITLTADPESGSTFTGWSGGGCGGTDSCQIVFEKSVSVEAVFDTEEDSADLFIEKQADSYTPNPGEIVTFTITVMNEGPDKATGIKISDPLPEGLTYVADNSQGTYDPGGGVWSIDELEDGSDIRLQIYAEVTASQVVTNTASIIDSDQTDPNQANNAAAVALNPSVLSADVVVAKSGTPNPVELGKKMNYSITIYNNGPNMAEGVNVTDVIPSAIDAPKYKIMRQGGGFEDWPGTSRIMLNDLEPGEVKTIKVKGEVTVMPEDGKLSNTASATSDTSDANQGNNSSTSDSVVLESKKESDLSILKEVDDLYPEVQENVTFTITATNNGPDRAENVVVKDKLAAGLVYVSHAGDGSYNHHNGKWKIDEMDTGSRKMLILKAKINNTGEIRNTAAILRSKSTDSNNANNSSTLTINGRSNTPDIGLSSSLYGLEDMNSNFLSNGDHFKFDLCVGGTGLSDSTGIQIKVDIPGGVQLTNAAPASGCYDSVNHIWYVDDPGACGGLSSYISEPRENLETEYTLSLNFEVTDQDQAGQGAIVAYIIHTDSDGVDPDMTNNTTGQAIEPGDLYMVDIAVDVQANRTEVEGDEEVVFTVLVRNTGPDAAGGLQVENILPNHFTWSGTNTSTGSYNRDTGLWTIGNLDIFELASLELFAVPVSEGEAVVTASLKQVAERDMFDDNNQDSVTVKISRPVVDTNPGSGGGGGGGCFIEALMD